MTGLSRVPNACRSSSAVCWYSAPNAGSRWCRIGLPSAARVAAVAPAGPLVRLNAGSPVAGYTGWFTSGNLLGASAGMARTAMTVLRLVAYPAEGADSGDGSLAGVRGLAGEHAEDRYRP